MLEEQDTETDEYDISACLEPWGCEHKTVCHSAGASARDDDGVGVHEAHVETLEGFWSLLRSWLRPRYLRYFACVHNVRRHGKALLGALLALLRT